LRRGQAFRFLLPGKEGTGGLWSFYYAEWPEHGFLKSRREKGKKGEKKSRAQLIKAWRGAGNPYRVQASSIAGRRFEAREKTKEGTNCGHNTAAELSIAGVGAEAEM